MYEVPTVIVKGLLHLGILLSTDTEAIQLLVMLVIATTVVFPFQ